MRHYHYAFNDGELARITASRRPSEKTKPRSTTWIMQQMIAEKWVVPSFPEITWAHLKTLIYLGSIPAESP